MRTQTHGDSGRRWRLLAALVLSGIGALYAMPAQAHFMLQQPPSWAVQNGNRTQPSYGGPQKSAPCGQADPGETATPTGAVTTYTAGQMITLNLTETIDHPGHYRVAIAQNQAGLPADPPVTVGATPCGTTTIAANPTLPLLADGLFPHMSGLGGVQQTAQIKLPDGYTCQNCTLQVIEFMSDHGLNNPGGCFYHHCANVNVVAPPSDDAGTTPPADMAMEPTPPPPAMSEGCSYVATAPRPGLLQLASLLFLGLGLFLRRRRASV